MELVVLLISQKIEMIMFNIVLLNLDIFSKLSIHERGAATWKCYLIRGFTVWRHRGVGGGSFLWAQHEKAKLI